MYIYTCMHVSLALYLRICPFAKREVERKRESENENESETEKQINCNTLQYTAAHYISL